MVPKRQIQLKKKKDAVNIINKEKTEKQVWSMAPPSSHVRTCLPMCLFTCLHVQVILKDGSAEGRVANSEVAANERLGPIVHRYPDLLLRQHSMPASLNTHSTTSSDVDSYRVNTGLVAGASQGNNIVIIPLLPVLVRMPHPSVSARKPSPLTYICQKDAPRNVYMSRRPIPLLVPVRKNHVPVRMYCPSPVKQEIE